MAGLQLVLFAVRFFTCIGADSLALRGTARLLSSVLSGRVIAHAVLLGIGAVLLPMLALSNLQGPPADALVTPSMLLCGAGLFCAVAAEILGRYLFFVSVVPQHQALPYVGLGSEAA
jgi:hypothetical protein